MNPKKSCDSGLPDTLRVIPNGTDLGFLDHEMDIIQLETVFSSYFGYIKGTQILCTTALTKYPKYDKLLYLHVVSVIFMSTVLHAKSIYSCFVSAIFMCPVFAICVHNSTF